MSRYIDADALGIGKANRDVFDNKAYADGWNAAIDIIESSPTADVVEAVRCKDCKFFCRGKMCYCEEFGGIVAEEDFCSRGERKTNKS